MTDDQLLRYSRHILLDDIGIEGQEHLLGAHALVIGAGGLGSPVALYLGSAGVGRITLVDNDADNRAVGVFASVGAIQDGDVSYGPTHGSLLNLITLTLEDVPAGTTEVTLELLSSVEGDSAAIVGAAANYACEAN